MGRRALKPSLQPPSPYKYNSDAEGLAKDKCETFEDYHVVRPSAAAWPPQSKGSDTEAPSTFVRCELCGTHCGIYADNDPVKSGILVITPERPKPATQAITT